MIILPAAESCRRWLSHWSHCARAMVLLLVALLNGCWWDNDDDHKPPVESPVRVQGYVVNGVLVGADVRLTDEQGSLLAKTKTDERGYFSVVVKRGVNYLLIASGGQLDGASYHGQLSARCSREPGKPVLLCDITPFSSAVAMLVAEGRDHAEVLAELAQLLGFSGDPFMLDFHSSASWSSPGFDLAALRLTLNNGRGLAAWLAEFIRWFKAPDRYPPPPGVIIGGRDTVAPELSLDNPAESSTAAAELTLTGFVRDNRQLRDLQIVSSRYDRPFAVNVPLSGRFSAAIPLRVGANELTVTARDAALNSSSRSIKVQRLSPPKFAGVSPADGSVLDSDSILISGVIETGLAAELLNLQVNAQTIAIGEAVGEGYRFSSGELPLAYGVNHFNLAVTSPDGSDQLSLAITRSPDDPDTLPLPELEVLTPNDGQWLATDSVKVSGRVISHAGAPEVLVNHAPVVVSGNSFSHLLSFEEGASELAITVVARDQLGRQSTRSLKVHRDRTAPMIELDTPLLPWPSDNLIDSDSLLLTGRVIEPRLASFTINGQVPALTPEALDVQRFTLNLNLGAGTHTITLRAQDDAGNIALLPYQVSLSPTALLEMILPQQGARFTTNGQPVTLSVAGRLAGTADGAEALATAAGQQFPLQIDRTLVTGTVTVPANFGSGPIRLAVRHAGRDIAAGEVTIDVVDWATVPLELVAMNPTSADGAIAPNSLLTFVFNKPVNPAQLQIAVKETLNGYGYQFQDAPGTDFTRAKGYQLVQVNRSQEPVAGISDLLADGRSLTFKADRFYGFGATLTIEVAHSGNTVARTSLEVMPLPTQASGSVLDQFGEPLADVPVQLAEFTTKSDSQGGYSFGFAEQLGKLPAGPQTLRINPGAKDPRLGSRAISVTLEQGQLNKLGARLVPLINEATGYEQLQSGLQTAIGQGQIDVDLRAATVANDSSSSLVKVNVQTLGLTQLDVKVEGVPPIGSIYVLQPAPIYVEGQPRISLPPPPPLPMPEDATALLAWMEATGVTSLEAQEGDLLLLLGSDQSGSKLTPVALMEMRSGRMTQVGDWHGYRLDYLALAALPPDAALAAEAYRTGSGSWSALRSALSL